jgi:monofunctional biosynthetic peptidoglycan transglycosylase
VRKAKEIMITFLLERALTKDRILEIYLNIVEWGEGVFGIEAASEAYFGRHAVDLTLDQAARLAAVIPSPLRHRPDGDGTYVMRRREIVLARMEARSMIPAGRFSTASADSGGTARDSSGIPAGGPGATAGEDTTEFEQGGANGS